MTFQIQLTTRDDQPLRFDCAPDQYLLAAAAAANIALPSQCGRGSCGACHATVTAGDYRLHEHNADALPAGAPGAILMCRTTPCSNLSIALPCDRSKILLQSIPWRTVKIVALEAIAQNTMRLELRLDPDGDGASAAEFEPGQFMELEIPDTGERRPYSLANTGNWDGRLEFLIRLHAGGSFSTFLRERAQPGDRLRARGAMGGFGIREGSLRARWLVAGGTGLAPMLSVLRRMDEYQEMQDVRLLFGVNVESELFMLDEIERLKVRLPQLRVDVCVWRPRGDWSGFCGTPADALRTALATTGIRPDVYVCGPPALIHAAQNVAAEAGLPPDQFRSEQFVTQS
jgi:ferredoxin-NADP reductase/ferredoxin